MESSDFERIAAQITRDESPVGIEAEKAHVMILLALKRLEARLVGIERRMGGAEGAE